ncbi:MAG: aminoacyl-tRNA hydrolase [Gemmatimonadaceae bacterium]|nr:aminoacyl-tRNA hydrolase [Gemmatimonadaceae bacterium]
MKVICGLGNPGKEYEQTRHNVGWWFLDHLADVWHLSGWRKDGDARVLEGTVRGQRVRLVKPLTFMNLSGAALKPYLRRAGWQASKDLLVVVDEVALPLGSFRLRAEGSAGGHNGLKSIQGALGGSSLYPRLRIGIKPVDERRSIGDLSDFVLSSFGKQEQRDIEELAPRLTEAVETWLDEGILIAMNKHNRSGQG